MSECGERTVGDAGKGTLGSRAADNETPRDLDPTGDAKKREALVRLRDRYVEAQKLVSSGEPHANLEWILGSRRNPTQDPLGLEMRTIELVALWLQDLAVELDRLPRPSTAELEPSALSVYEARESVVQRLRDATESFLVAFRRPS